MRALAARPRLVLAAAFVWQRQSRRRRHGVEWQHREARQSDVGQLASLQRGAANFVNYCLGCHSLKYMRSQRMGEDLDISPLQLTANLIPTGAKPTDYMISSFPRPRPRPGSGARRQTCRWWRASAAADWVYRFLKGFYVDDSRPPAPTTWCWTARPCRRCCPTCEGVQGRGIRRAAKAMPEGKVVERFETVSPGA